MANPILKISDPINRLRANAGVLLRRIRHPLTFTICRFLIRLHINQTHLTLTRIFLVIGLYFVWDKSSAAALALLLGDVVLDCLDGDLSRMLGNDNAVGEFEDLFADNLIFLIFPLALIHTGLLSGALGVIFVFCSFSVLCLAERKQTCSGDTLIFHPKGDLFLSLSRKAVWILMYLFIFFKINIFNEAYIAITAVLLTSLSINYFQIISSRLKPL